MESHNLGSVRGILKQIFPKEKVVNFTVMSVEEKKNKQGEVEAFFSYVPLVAFGHEANTLKTLSAGDQITVEYSAGTNMYEKDGKKIYSTQLKAKCVAVHKRANPSDSVPVTTKGSFDEATSFDDVF